MHRCSRRWVVLIGIALAVEGWGEIGRLSPSAADATRGRRRRVSGGGAHRRRQKGRRTADAAGAATTADMQMVVAPPGSDTAKFQVSGVEASLATAPMSLPIGPIWTPMVGRTRIVSCGFCGSRPRMADCGNGDPGVCRPGTDRVELRRPGRDASQATAGRRRDRAARSPAIGRQPKARSAVRVDAMLPSVFIGDVVPRMPELRILRFGAVVARSRKLPCVTLACHS